MSTAGLNSRQLAVGLALAAVGSVAFSGKAIIVKLAYRYDVDAVTLIMYRMLFALPIFLFMSWWAGRGKPPLSRQDQWAVVGLGFVGYYLASFLDFAGLSYISASLERLILYLNPTLVLMLAWAMHRKPIGRREALGMLISYSGVVLVFGHEIHLEGTGTLIGSVLVFGSALSYAVYLSFSAEMVKRLGSMRLVGLATSVACVFCLLQFVMLRPLSAAQVAMPVIWLSVLNAIACTAAPVVMVMMALERIGPSLTAQTGMVGPLATIFLGVVLLGEPFTAFLVAGSVLVIAGVFVVSAARRGAKST